SQYVDTNRPLQFQKCRQLFIRTHNETLFVAAMRVGNPDCSPIGIELLSNVFSVTRVRMRSRQASTNEKLTAFFELEPGFGFEYEHSRRKVAENQCHLSVYLTQCVGRSLTFSS